jgi:acetyl esterase/lipase
MRKLVRAFCILVAAMGLAGEATASPPLETYGKLPALELVRLSPSGDRIAFIAVDGEHRRLFVRQVGGDALDVSDVGESKIWGLDWAGEDYVVVTGSGTVVQGNGIQTLWKNRARAEVIRAMIVNLKTRQVHQIFENDHNVFYQDIRRDYGARNIDGRWVEILAAWVKGALSFVKVDLETNAYKASAFNQYPYIVGNHFVDEAGAVAAGEGYDEPTRSWSLYSGPRLTRKVVTWPSLYDDIDIAGPGRLPQTVVVHKHDGAADDWFEADLTGAKPPTPIFEGRSVEDLLLDPSGIRLIGARLAGGANYVFFDPVVQRRFEAMKRAYAKYRVTLISYADELKRAVILTDGADDPGTYWLVDMASGHAQDLMSAYPGLEPKDVGPTQLFTYKAADGTALDGVLTLPPGSVAKNLPIVVMPHGGPIGVYDSVGFDWWAQAFASRGYAVFQPNYRGSGGHGKPLEEAGMGQFGRAMLTDIRDGFRALVDAGVADPKRACIVGASYGGYAALASVTILDEPYRCSVSYAGVTEVGAFMALGRYDDETAYGRSNQRFYGSKTPYGPDITSISPIRFAANAHAPILLIHGKDDVVLPVVNTYGMQSVLEKAGKPVEVKILESTDHWLTLEKTRIETIKASVAFVEAHNSVAPIP